MNKKRVHTPEGVRDVYGTEYGQRSKLKAKLNKVFASYGYEGIRTPGFEFFDTQLLQNTCDNLEIPLFIEKSNAKEIVFDIRKEKNPCSLCANLRRGIINSIAIREGCNKIALGHNQDDVLETFLLNLFYTGSIGTFSPLSYMDRTKITLIRPLIYTPEKDTKRFVRKNNLTVMPKVCPMDRNFKKRRYETINFFII